MNRPFSPARRYFTLFVVAMGAAVALLPPRILADDITPPTVTGVWRSLPAGPNTTASTVIFRASFSEPVTSFSTTSFDLTTTGTVAGTIGEIWGGGAERYVTVHSIVGSGTLRVNVRRTTVKDLAGNLLAADYTHGSAYGRLASSILVAWGGNQYQTLGDNSAIDRPAPVAVQAGGVMAGQTIAIAAGGVSSSQAFSREGKLFAWGHGYYGQLGNNQNDNSPVPVAVKMDSGLAGQDVITAATGGRHALALSRFGYVFAWGNNEFGQLGNGNNTDYNHPQAVDRMPSALLGKRVVAISAGYDHSLALADDGRVYAWGRNDHGQLGDNSITNRNQAVAVDVGGVLAGKFVVAIGAGGGFSAALTSEGRVVAWGSNGAGNLGCGNYNESHVPVEVDRSGVLDGKTVVALAVGSLHCLAQTSDGMLYSWGFNVAGQLGNGTTTFAPTPVTVGMSGVLAGKSIVAISVCGATSFALDSIGQVYSWGHNGDGALGQGTTGGFTTSPGAVVNSGVLAERSVFALGAGSIGSHMLALARAKSGFFQMLTPANGSYATGAGLDFTVSFTEPVAVTGTPQLALAVGSATVLANHVTTNGSGNLVFRYIVQPGDFDADGVTVGSIDLNGGTIRDRFGYDVLTAVPPQAMPGVLIDASSPVVASSVRFHPQATTTASGSLVFRVIFDRAVTGVDAADFSLATTGSVTGSVTTVSGSGANWYAVVTGVNGSGALRLDLKASGTGIMDARGNPMNVGFDGGQFFLHTTATALATWGNDDLGQLGLDGSGHSLLMPTALPSAHALAGKTIAAMATGTAHTLALSSSGQVVAWGDNSHGALGDNSNDNSPVPVAVPGSGALGGKTVMAIAAAGGHSLALTSDGLVFAWGLNDAGQLGTNTGDVNVPTAVQTSGPLAGKFIVAIAAGGSHSLALASDGGLFAWGSNSAGQLGRASGSGDSLTPVAVDQTAALAGKSVVAIAAGGNHSLALTADGRVFAWGQNLYGQLGDGNPGSNQTAPAAVLRTGVLASQQIIAVAAGNIHSLALSATGQLFAWGENGDGQIGDGLGYYTYASPTAVVMTGALANKTVTAIHAGARHNLVLSSTGQAFSWGDNTSYQLGSGGYGDAIVPITVSTAGVLANQTLLATGGGAGAMHSIVLLDAAAIPFTGIETWRNQHFATPFNSGPAADTADADGDGRPNLLEYALNSSPLAPDAGSGTTLGTTFKGTFRHLTLSFDRIADPALVYRVEASNTLADESWTTIFSSSGASNVAGTTLVHDSVPISGTPKRFLRVQVGF